MQIYAVESADKGVMHKGHVRCDVDNGVGELEGLASRGGRKGGGGGVWRVYGLVLAWCIQEFERLVGPDTFGNSLGGHPQGG